MKLAPALRDVFVVDLRTLALFRVALGAVLLSSLLQRFADLAAFQSDLGVLPRDALIAAQNPWHWSLHFIHGSTLFQGALLALQCLLAVAFLIGRRTRLAAILSWVLLASLHARNPLVLSGADQLLICLLFWSMFLPLGARYSADAALSTAPPPGDHRHLSWAGAALLLQVLSVYFFSALLKSGTAWWPDGTAVRMALDIDRFATPAGHWLRASHPWALPPLTYFVYFLELLGPLAALLPWAHRPLRFVVLLLLMVMHAGFIVLLSVGTFPFVSLASLAVLLGGGFWDRAARRDAARRPIGPKIFYDRDCGFCFRTCLLLREFLVLPRAEIAPAQDRVRTDRLMQAHYSWVVIDATDVAHIKWSAFVELLRQSPLFSWLGRLLSPAFFARAGDAAYDFVGRHRGRFGRVLALLLPARAARFEAPARAQWLAAFALALVMAWNLTSVGGLPPAAARLLAPVMYGLHLDQTWSMFAPYPAMDDGWYVVPGRREDGTEVDVLHPERRGVGYDKPADVAADIGNARWQSYQARLYLRYDRRFRLHYARYLCREWNRRAESGKHLESLKLIYMLERARADGTTAPLEQVVLWRHECRTPPDGRADPD